MEKKTFQLHFNAVDIFRVLIKWWKLLVIVEILAIVGAAVFSGPRFITPRYKSYAIIYPAYLKQDLYTNYRIGTVDPGNVVKFSQDATTTEEMLQIFESDDIKFKVIEQFNLDKDYKINKDDKYYLFKMLKTFDENIKVSKTNFEAIKIVVIHTIPEKAKDICVGLIDAYNQKMNSTVQQKYNEIAEVLYKQMKDKRHEIDSFENILSDLRVKYGIVDLDLQNRELLRGYFEMLNKNSSNIGKANNMLNNMWKQGEEINSLRDFLLRERYNYDQIKFEYENMLRNKNKTLTFYHEVSKPYVNYKKAYPVRWLIVFFAAFSSFIFLTIVLIVKEGFVQDKSLTEIKK